MLKKVMSVGLILVFIFSLSGCERDWSKDFNLSEETVIWDETAFEESWYEEVYGISIKFKSTTTYPKLKLKDLKLKNAKELIYTSTGPYEGIDRPTNQIATVKLKKYDKESIIEAVRHLESLPFICYVFPEFGEFELLEFYL